MGQDKDISSFIGGMDKDTDLRSVRDGDFIDALNTHNAITDGANRTGVENVRGNEFVSNGSLPPWGDNQTIGFKEDNKDDTGIYCVYNSNGYHGIYRYFRSKPPGQFGQIEKLLRIESPDYYPRVGLENPLNFNPERLITGVDLVDDLFFWTDFNMRPRMINIKRANNTDKRFKFRIYFSHEILATTGSKTFNFNVYQNNGAQVLNLAWNSSSKTLSGLVTDFFHAYQGSTAAVDVFSLTDMGDYAVMEMTQAGNYFAALKDISDPLTVNWVVPDNFYPEKMISVEFQNPGVIAYDYFSQDLIDRVKYPSQCAPIASYKTDTQRKVNLVQERVFQFRTQYVYDNYEKSVWGAISNIAIASGSCSQTENSIDNYIEVDFSDPRLNNPSLNCIIRSVNIAVREHNEGDWMIVENLEPHQWGIGKQVYKFYNDRINTILSDQNSFVKPYDAVGLKVKGQRLINDRLFDAGIVEGYDKPNIDFKLDVSYEPPTDTKTYSIKGIVSVRSIHTNLANPLAVYHQPVFDAGTIQFGGCDPVAYLSNQNSLFNDQVIAANQQQIPLRGFTVYLAGTPYYAITHQNWVQNGLQGGVENYYITGTQPQRTQLAEIMTGTFAGDKNAPFSWEPYGPGAPVNDQSGAPIGDTSAPPSRVFSYFEIKNVPPGKYVLRFASHLITQGDIDNNRYQKTSTNVISVGGENGTAGGGYEKEIIVSAANAVNGVIYVGASAIADVVNHYDLSDDYGSQTICGYLTDHDNPNPAASFDGYMFSETTRIERSFALLNLPPSLGNNLATNYLNPCSSDFYKGWIGQYPSSPGGFLAVADHNGYFYYSRRSFFVGPDLNYTAFFTGTNHCAIGGAFQSGGNGTNAWPTQGVSPKTTLIGVFRNIDDTVSTIGRTFLEGDVVDSQGGNISGVNVVNTHGAVQKTVGSGFKIPCYIDSWFFLNNTDDFLRTERLLLSSGDTGCLLQFVKDEYLYSVNIGTAPGYYNSTNIRQFGFIIANYLSSIISKCAFKNGSDIQFGVVYYDQADRPCSVVTNDSLKIHFPFYTESTVVTGAPVVKWSIYNDPPPWATKWQIVRTKNTQLNYYLQWAIDKIEYWNDTETQQVSRFDASKIHIYVTNLAKYSVVHPNSSVSYSFNKGDRFRPIRSAGGNLFNKYFDVEVLEAATNGAYIVISNNFELNLGVGDLYEIYTPRSQNSINVFYEFGECYEVGVAFMNGIKKYYHKGQTNQGYGTLPMEVVTPATGTMMSGDVYYRIRNIPVLIPNTTNYGFTNSYIDDGSVSDFFESDDEMIGRPRTDAGDIGQLFRPTAIRFSNRLQQDTKINGLASFDALNQKQISTDYGLINRLMLIGDDVLMAICNNSKIVTMYINKSILRQATGAALLVAISDEVIAQTNNLMQTLGSQNPESVVINDEKDVFLWDKQVAVIPRYTGNELTSISDFKLVTYFNDWSEIQLKYPPEKVITPAVYDRFFDEYVISRHPIAAITKQFATATICVPDMAATNNLQFNLKLVCQPNNITVVSGIFVNYGIYGVHTNQSLQSAINNSGTGFTATIDADGCVVVKAPVAGTVYNNNALVLTITQLNGTVNNYSYPMTDGTDTEEAGSEGDTVAFSKTKDRWVTRYSFQPEYFGSIRNEIISFVNGELWLHNIKDVYNNFYNTQYKSQVTFPSNKAPLKVKIFKALAENANSVWSAPEISIPADTQTPTGMESFLPVSKFVVKEGKFYSDILNDLNTPYAVNPTEALLNGRPMRGEAVKITLESDATDLAVLYATEVIYIYSEKS